MHLSQPLAPSHTDKHPDVLLPSGVSRIQGPCNLVLVLKDNANDPADFEKIAGYVHEIDAEIHTYVVTDKRHWSLLPKLMLRPTFVFCPIRVQRFKPLRGRTLCGRSMPKSAEYAALEKAGFSVPHWESLAPGAKPEHDAYGPYVVTKPDQGGRGAMVNIQRIERVRGEMVTAAVARKPSPLLVQKFIYTGPFPISYRVTTLFGKVLYSLKVEASHERAALDGPEAFGNGEGVSIVSTGNGCTKSLQYDDEIIRYGEAAHAAFPEIPLLGIDVLREVPSGKLYISEVNAVGLVWHFSSPRGLKSQREFGYDLEGQFDGLRRAAAILAEKTRQLAT